MPRKYESTTEIAASAEDIWRVLSEADGLKSWFAPEAQVQPGPGGSVTISWGPGMEATSQIEAWEPGQTFRFSNERHDGRGTNFIEFTIEARDSAQCTLRVVNAGFGDDASFDGEIESLSHAWPNFIALLRHSAERKWSRCRNVTRLEIIECPRPEVWERLTAQSPGEELYVDPYGCGCWLVDGSPLAIFAENGGKGKTMLTIMRILFDPTAEAEQAAATAVDSFMSRAAPRT